MEFYAREAQVDALARGDAGSTATRGTALAAEHRAHGGLAQRQAHALTHSLQALSQTNGNRGLALAGGRGGERTHQNQAPALAVLLQHFQAHLGLVVAIGNHIFLIQPEFGCHLCSERRICHECIVTYSPPLGKRGNFSHRADALESSCHDLMAQTYGVNLGL